MPFVGSGMSIPACRSWPDFVSRLEEQASVDKGGSDDLISRAFIALQVLRQQQCDLRAAIAKGIYSEQTGTPNQAKELASIFWPLVCTTNYDDIYLRAKLECGFALPRLLGRSEIDCRHVLRHIGFPSGEVVWALQGLLHPIDRSVQGALGPESDIERLEQELVVGHAEYRKAAHRAPHFRRCFAELFRTRSLLFLGSGLGEPYFLTLFDEIIELTGPPVRPHFAVIQEGSFDPEVLRKQYHIICNIYPRGKHECITELLNRLRSYLKQDRTRPGSWGFRLRSPDWLSRDNPHPDHFSVIRAAPPDPRTLPKNEVVAISCGREEAVSPSDSPQGRPLVSEHGGRILRLSDRDHSWHGDWLVRWKSIERAYGIVARDPVFIPGTSRDRRSLGAIRDSFQSFLEFMKKLDTRVAHVQLLAAGRSRVFEPWVSLLQMARAYGEWVKQSGAAYTGSPRVKVYVVDPAVIAMLSGGYIDLAQELQSCPLHINVEIVDLHGSSERYHYLVAPEERVRYIVERVRAVGQPLLYALPTPRRLAERERLANVLNRSVREFGLVSGSTLVIDYRGGNNPASLRFRTT